MSAVAEHFQRELDRGRAADAYLFLGRSRAALRRAAEDAAARLLGARGAVADHPDLVLFDPVALGVSGLRVEHVALRREGVPCVESALRYRPVAGARRAVILLDADRMGADAQAALLKTAEEPPAGTVLLLTAGDLSPLLPALRSRCRTYRVAEPPAVELERLAAAAGLEGADWSALRQACGGGEAALDLDPAERGQLLADHASFQRWLAGDETEGGWLALPAGSGQAEQRAAARLRLAAALGWLAAACLGAAPDRALRLDRAARELTRALEDLEHQITPAILFEDLTQELVFLP